MASRLLDSWSPSVVESGPRVSSVTVGLPWHADVSGQITAIHWYCTRATSTGTPTAVRVYDRTLGVQLWTSGSISTPASTGWKTITAGLPVAVAAGHAMWLLWDLPVGNFYAEAFTAGFPGAEVPLVVEVPSLYFTSPAPSNNPATSISGAIDLMDLTYEPDEGPSGQLPATPSDIASALTDWLDTVEGTQTHSAPLLDHATLATVDANTAAVKADADDWAFGLGAAAHGYYADVKTLIGNIKTVTDTLPTPIAQLTSIVLDHYTADIAGILAQIDTVLSNLGAQSTDLSGTAGSAVGALSGRTGFPATGWSMSAEADFEDAIAFSEPADAYVLSITSWQDTQPANASPAGLWLPRLGWWCVLNGTLASQRQFVDFEQMLLEDQGRRMPGCAIQLRPGTLATVQAWLLA